MQTLHRHYMSPSSLRHPLLVLRFPAKVPVVCTHNRLAAHGRHLLL